MICGANLPVYQKMIENQYLAGLGPVASRMGMAKTDNPITTTAPDGGRFNATFGPSLFAQLQNSSVLFGALPKFDYVRDGYRAQTTRFVTYNTTTEGDVYTTENATLPDSIAPRTLEISVGVQEQIEKINYSQKMLLLAGKQDDIAMDAAQLIESAKEHFIYKINQALNVDVTTLPASGQMQSIDRIVSSYAEVTNCSDLTAGDADIYGQDRDAAASWCDAYVNHNSGTARPLSKKIMRDLRSNTVKAGADPKYQFWYTGTDTWDNIEANFESQIRYVAPETFFAKTFPTEGDGKAFGINFGQEMATLLGRPVHVAPAGEVVANGDISNLYLLSAQPDKVTKEPVLGIKVLQAPIQTDSRFVDYPKDGKIGNAHLIYSAMELHCSRFNIQGKARDLAVVV